MSKREQELMETRTDKTWPTNKFSFAQSLRTAGDEDMQNKQCKNK